MYLHAQAQKDVLSVFEKITKQGGNIVFSTHSPYLLDPDRLNRIRLVTKSKVEGTQISNKIHKGIDADSLTPIVTAIGHDIYNKLSLSTQECVITEGITDYYILTAFGTLFPDRNRQFSIVPGASANKAHLLASLFIGWNIKFVVVLDADRAGKNAQKDMQKLDVAPDDIIFCSQENGLEIEDLFSKDDFIKHFVGGEVAVDFEQNSNM